MAFGLLIIGDEILSGKRADKHVPKVIEHPQILAPEDAKYSNINGKIRLSAFINRNGGIQDLTAPELRLAGQGRGPLSDMLRYVNVSPIGGWIGQAFGSALSAKQGWRDAILQATARSLTCAMSELDRSSTSETSRR